ncbi:gamma-glutamyl-gamma-aminobutyrate hydrolase family protein [Sporosarcina sp. HYO08]|uniref:gamma-glutamyl-gamma-aminobutyrate hydrolase family protein n=1 Tax=Sporosarcina sp. HYO08 TaxID=1759557 RepID=UPI0007991A31|nr:gamma-glutamyl-gamma-aminobutyrate hydrolase family protein [Sporosarcina sp. HYO08]KXH87077.1 gamma-glutamyl-gamma-aminobutyrate hydrolase [Sporosarcina sp. HYO08]
MKPVIGITTDVKDDGRQILKSEYVQAIIRAGGLPFIVPVGVEENAAQIAGMLDGLLLSGGHDINPLLFHEEPHRALGGVSPERDASELVLAKEMAKLDKPILGICRGLQVINVAFGGTLLQDIYKQSTGELIQHIQQAPNDHATHFVQLTQGSLLETIAGKEKIVVNSFHHQALKDAAPGFRVTGVASDGIIEVLESENHRFILGVQWHPEQLLKKDDAVSLRIFEKFIEECKKESPVTTV